MGTVIIPVLQTWKLRFREVKRLASGLAARRGGAGNPRYSRVRGRKAGRGDSHKDHGVSFLVSSGRDCWCLGEAVSPGGGYIYRKEEIHSRGWKPGTCVSPSCFLQSLRRRRHRLGFLSYSLFSFFSHLSQGTVIRVFSIPEGQKLFEFRRGVKRCVSICSLAFSMDSMFLSASSNTETVHIFKLETVKEKPQEEPTTWTGYFGKVLMASTSYLPSQVTEMFNQGRAFATVRLPFCGHKNICSLATIQKIPRLLVGASDGYLYMYNLDPQEGGECTLMKQHKLDGSMETTNEILDSASHDCPLVTQAYSTAVTTAYTDELGAVGGTCLEEEASALRLEEDSEHPPMILRTD
ncbi:WD repeat domain phosphoinositide-interacting protein 2-like [Leptonychotes weddellii]|uniref:WD repeat domain phosphoinositide-interacting protein 2-like n=1 Tax=Leptonychotes weddellii TaxID=9713 RepID=A0A7F8QAB0_LEPWE|nr:WD repeat domain phosphoinositide-interacting protein 2-like [Leptonychotes weddellii]